MTDDVDLGCVYYVVERPKKDPARVVAGPIEDPDQAERRAMFSTDPNARVMLGIWLVANIREFDYNVEWDDADPPEALVATDGGHSVSGNDRSPTLIRQGGIQQRLRCSGQVASQIERTFVTAEQLIDAVEADELEERDGIGPKTAEKIREWYENAEEREKQVNKAVVEKQSARSATISFYKSWADALGIEVSDDGE